MDDLISRQLVMKTLCERRCGDKPKGCPSGFCTESLAMDCIPSAKPAQQWIPCSERLPEPWTSVLVTYIYNGKRFVEESQYTGQDDERGNPLFSSYADEYKVSNAYFQKIAWMPLPVGYSEDKRVFVTNCGRAERRIDE